MLAEILVSAAYSCSMACFGTSVDAAWWPSSSSAQLQSALGVAHKKLIAQQLCSIMPPFCLLQTAAAVLAVLNSVLAGSDKSAAAGYPTSSHAGFCVVRPPGHHVLPSRPMGFGLVNFMAVAARHAQQQQTVPVHKVCVCMCVGIAALWASEQEIHALAVDIRQLAGMHPEVGDSCMYCACSYRYLA